MSTGRPPRGIEHHNAKLNDSKVRAMRGAYKPGNLKLIAKKYRISIATAFRVVNRVTWKHVE
jgi:Mor family transcriptional regulator